MPRKLRLEYAGARYHVTNRGDRGEPIFRDDEDHTRFLATLAEASAKAGWQVHAYCLLPNHFHLVLETPQPGLVVGVKWLLGTYTNRFNRRHRVTGHVFGGRYRAIPIAPEGGYLRTAGEHVHLNPARANLLRADQPLATFAWSSYPEYLHPASKRPGWLRVDRLLAALGLEDDPAGRGEFARIMERRRSAQTTDDWAGLRRGWCFGDPDFRLSLLDRLSGGREVVQYGAEPPDSAACQGERIVTEELSRLGWEETVLVREAKTTPEKLVIARRLRAETVLSLRWIARRLSAGSSNTLRNALQRVRPGPARSSAFECGVAGEPAAFNVAWD